LANFSISRFPHIHFDFLAMLGEVSCKTIIKKKRQQQNINLDVSSLIEPIAVSDFANCCNSGEDTATI
jgi:hypothetical protein